MVTVKKEVPIESAVLEHTQQRDFDHFGGPTPTHGPVPMIRQQQFWSHPGPAGPQERYESEFQVSPLSSFLANNPQPKPDNRTIPTTLDQYEMQLRLLEQQNKKRAGSAGQEQESEEWTPQPGWNEFVAADYQTQLKLLEEQNKTRLQMAGTEQESMRPVSGSVWTPPPGWRESLLPDYQEALKYLEKQGKPRLEIPKEENGDCMAPPVKISRGTTVELIWPPSDMSRVHSLHPQGGGAFAAGADYAFQLTQIERQKKKRLTMARQEQDAMAANQMQLMLLEQQKKRQIMMARQYQGAMAGQNGPSTSDIGAGFREQSVESNSTWSTQFTPESTPGFQEGREPSVGTLNQIRLNFMESNPHGSDSSQHSPQPSCNCASSGQILRDHDVQVAMLEKQNQANAREVKREEDDIAASSTVPDWSLQHYQEELMLKEQRARVQMEMRRGHEGEMTAASATPGNHALQDYQMQLMLLEQQNKRRKMSQRQEEQRRQEGVQQSQIRQIETQNRKRLMIAREEATMAKEKMHSQLSTSSKIPDQNLDEEREVEGDWISYGSRDMHKKPLVIRERPTCDD